MPRARWPSCLKRAATSRAHHQNRHQHHTGTEAHPVSASASRTRHQQTPPFKHLLAKFFCCYHSADSLQEQSSGDQENMQMGPLTLEDYIKTLEPYDPALHGWRGDEPWKLRTRTTIITITCKYPNNNCAKDINGNGNTNGNNGMLMQRNQCLSNYCADNILYI